MSRKHKHWIIRYDYNGCAFSVIKVCHSRKRAVEHADRIFETHKTAYKQEIKWFKQQKGFAPNRNHLHTLTAGDCDITMINCV